MSEKKSAQIQEPSVFMAASLLLLGVIILVALIMLVILGAKAAYNLMTEAKGTETTREEALVSAEEPHPDALLSDDSFDSLDPGDIEPPGVIVWDMPLLEDVDVDLQPTGPPAEALVDEREENVTTTPLPGDPAEEVSKPIASGRHAASSPAPPPASPKDSLSARERVGRDQPHRERAPSSENTEPGSPSSTEASRPMSNQALAAHLQSLSPRILEIRFAVGGGRRTPRVVLRSDTSEEEALSVAVAVLGDFLARESWTVEEVIGTRSGFRGVYVDLPPDSVQDRQTLEFFALRGLAIDGTRTEDRRFGAPYLLSVQEVYERNGVAMCCRNRPIGEVRGREVILR